MSPFARVVRGGLAGSLSAAVAGASHFAVDPARPAPLVVAAAVTAAIGVCVLLAGHRMGPVRLGAAVALSQGAYHLLFSRPGTHTAGAAPGPGHGADLAAGHPHPPGALSPDVALLGSEHWPMLLVHLLAVVATYFLLRHGERAWWSVADVLGTPVRRLLAPSIPPINAPRPLRRPHRPLPHALHDLGCALRIITPRGPPVPVS
ncbi:hypothetical protein [Kocuria rosea]|uniref:Uncharacterized protein n=1 Tax=Kocuria rosea TaxID=1275 RepID=A0A4R5YPD1_KOCRO|nr:hypothetical protein [Kocuria rosea]TDL46552.1 hypothetical protein E2R59_00565 [Kocuria rosea]